MNYVKDVLSYYFKNFIYILVLVIGPAVFFGFLLRPFALFDFLYNYPNLTLNSFGDFYLAVFGFDWLNILWIALGFIILIVFASLMLGFIEGHFRTGKPSFKNYTSINNNLISVTKVVLCLAVITFVINIVLMLLMFLVHVLSATDGVGTIWGTVINYIIAILGLYPLARIYSLFAFATVEMMINGSPLIVALSNATQMVARNAWQVFAMEVVIFIPCFVLAILMTALGVSWLGGILGIIIFLPLMCIFGVSMFFDYYGIPKYNNRKYYYVR